MKISTPLVTLCAAAALALPAAHAAVAPLPSGNLLQNPGAEAAPGGKNYEQVTVPGWTTVNGFNALAYLPGSLDLPSTADAGRLAAGANFFVGGGGSDASASATQTVDVSAGSVIIDAGTARARPSPP
jgi:hypothetical protein